MDFCCSHTTENVHRGWLQQEDAKARTTLVFTLTNGHIHPYCMDVHLNKGLSFTSQAVHFTASVQQGAGGARPRAQAKSSSK